MDAGTVVTLPPPPESVVVRRRWNADRIVALTAIAIGVFSLFVTVYQTYLTRQAQSASVLPYLAFGVTPGRLLKANTTIQMFGGGGGPDRGPMLGNMLRLFALADAPPAWLASLGATATEKAVMEVEYSSVYGDRWRLRADQRVPQSF
jgi:hypothetical protein